MSQSNSTTYPKKSIPQSCQYDTNESFDGERYPGEWRDLLNTLHTEAWWMGSCLHSVRLALLDASYSGPLCREQITDLRAAWQLIDDYLGGEAVRMHRAHRVPGSKA